MERGLGYIPSPIDDRDFKIVGDATSLFGYSLPAAPDEDLELCRLVDRVNNQISTQTCVLQALQQGHYVSLGHHGKPLEYMSVLAGYWDARKRGGTEKYDMGCYPRLAWQAMSGTGFCKEKFWPFDPAKVNRPPSFDVRAAAIDQKWIDGYYQLWGLTDRVEELKATISQGNPVTVGTIVDDAFKKYRSDGAEPLEHPTQFGGRHMMLALGYDMYGLWVLNSWGEKWGAPDPFGRFKGGWFRMGWQWVRWPQTTDLWAVTVPKEFAL